MECMAFRKQKNSIKKINLKHKILCNSEIANSVESDRAITNIGNLEET